MGVRPATEDGMQAGRHPQAIATKVLPPRGVGLIVVVSVGRANGLGSFQPKEARARPMGAGGGVVGAIVEFRSLAERQRNNA